MEEIKRTNVNFLHNCCEDTIKNLYTNFRVVCRNTKLHYNEWHKERRYRITGSVCYNLFTYTSNRNPDWTKKCHDFFFPKNFRSQYTEYGKKTEGEAREAFKKISKKTVVETGLVISQQNPWLAYSPDGVIVKDGVLLELLEIKCPFKGKTKNIAETIEAEIGKSLVKTDEKIYLKQKHVYYGQVQLGMAVLNVKKMSFVIYSSFDKIPFIIAVDFDEVFVKKMLISLKSTFYQKMLHFICTMKKDSEQSH